jgi:CDP-2,3-bis-(O-geranylgeranyl)-sn-glycerol synthase
LAATTIAAYLIGQSVLVGSIVAAAAMAGDLASSFVKRRFGLPSSSQVIGLDQIPEALLPLIAVCLLLSLSLTDMAVTLLAFFVGDLLLSRIFFRLGVRDRPY